MFARNEINLFDDWEDHASDSPHNMAFVFNSMNDKMSVRELKPVIQFIPPEIISAITERMIDQPFDLTAITSFNTHLAETEVIQSVTIDILLISKAF